MLDMVKGCHLQLWCCPPLFLYFKWFNIKAATCHYPVTQKKVDKLFAKGTIEQSTGGVAFTFTQMCLWFLSILVVMTYSQS